MNIFLENAQSYFDAGFAVVPLDGKAPYFNDWLNVDFEGKNAHEGRTLYNKNIGLKTGKASGVIVVDVDTYDADLKIKIEKILPPIFCGKIGNKDKGKNWFFQYNGEESRKIGNCIDILSDGKQTVLPPSIHPEKKYAYEWIGRSLLDIDIDDLPILSDEMVRELELIVPSSTHSATTEMIRTNGRCAHNSHNNYSAILVAAANDYKQPQQIIEELLEYDSNHNPEVSYFLCKTRRWKSKDRRTNAFNFVMEYFNKNPDLLKKCQMEVVIDLAIDKKPTRKPFPHLRGMMQEMFKVVYHNSPKKRSRFAFASAITAMSIIVGNRIRYQNIHPNLYTLLLAASGEGKDVPLKFPKKLLIESGLKQFIGQSNPASDSGILKGLSDENNKRLDTIDEADTLFTSINATNSPWASKMGDVYAALFTSCGEYFEGKTLASSDKRIGECQNPYISILAAMTPKAFSDSFTTKTIEKGLGARFIYFIDEEKKKNELISELRPIPERVKTFAKMWNTESDFLNLSDNIPEAKISEAAKELLRQVNEQIETFKEMVSDESKMKPIYNRMYVLVVKMALLDACSISNDCRIVIDVDSVKWALDFVTVYHDNMKDFIESAVSDSVSEKNKNTITRVLLKHREGISKSDLYKATRRLSLPERQLAVRDLIESGEVKEFAEKDSYTKIKYILSKYCKGGV